MEKDKKKLFEWCEFEIVNFASTDVITTSTTDVLTKSGGGLDPFNGEDDQISSTSQYS
jgi:hypothetical protein